MVMENKLEKIGQNSFMDNFVKTDDILNDMYDDLKRSEGDNPTNGIVLCSDTDDDIARYSVSYFALISVGSTLSISKFTFIK